MKSGNLNFADGYKRANCCRPEPSDTIAGYYSYNGVMIVHKSSCGNLKKVEAERIVALKWPEILAEPEDSPDDDIHELEELDFKILEHHDIYGVDYSLKMAGMLHESKQDIFNHHKKLREMKLVSRVKKLIIQYRKGIVDNKWIKHRNHTYYELTDKGKRYLDFYRKNKI